MSFALYALLTPAAPPMSLETFKAMLDDRFGRSRGFKSSYEVIPLIHRRSIRAEWDGWSIVLSYSEGQAVVDDSLEIQRRLGEAAPPGLELIDRRIYAVFADDPHEDFNTPAVETIRLLTRIPGAIVYDPTQNNITSPL